MKTLRELSDDGLSAIFAIEVCHWTNVKPDKGRGGILLPCFWWDEKGYPQHNCNFAQSADAVLPWAEKADYWEVRSREAKSARYVAHVEHYNCRYSGDGPTLARALCVALIERARAQPSIRL